MLVRDRLGELRAFLNVCRHRGSLLVEGGGSRAALQCPYHAWTYDLDGSLRTVPRAEREPGFDPSDLSLVPLRLDAWGPFLFVTASADAPPLAEALGELPALVTDAGVDADRLVFHRRAHSELAANWKLACENYLECYHCPVAHPGFSALVDVRPDAYVLERTSRSLFTQVGPLRAGAAADGAVRRSQFHFLWPNLRVNIFPGEPNLSIGPLLPAGPERSTGFLDYFFGPDAGAPWIDELLAFDDQVGAEDRRLVESVQQGVRTGLVAEGRLLPESERLVAGFQQLVREALDG